MWATLHFHSVLIPLREYQVFCQVCKKGREASISSDLSISQTQKSTFLHFNSDEANTNVEIMLDYFEKITFF